jgi:hypothetical protein
MSDKDKAKKETNEKLNELVRAKLQLEAEIQEAKKKLR